MRFSLSALALPALSLAALAAPLAAAPAPAEEVVTVRINYSDIDLTSVEGQAALEARIDAQLRKACTITKSSPYGYGRPLRDEACIAKARSEAIAKADRIAAAKQRSGREVAAN